MPNAPVALITGAARGIGEAQALELARRGYRIALADVLEDPLNETASRVAAVGPGAVAISGDLLNADYWQTCVDRTVEAFGRLDVFIHSATWRRVEPITTASVEDWDKTLRIGLTAPAFIARAAAPHMAKQGGGVMVMVSSIMADHTAGICPSYVVTKGGIDSLTRELAVTFGQQNIRVVSLRPGAVNTQISNDYKASDGSSITDALRSYQADKTPLRRWAEPEEIAKATAWLVSDEAGYINATTIDIDGGLSAQFSPYSLLAKQFPDTYKP